MGVSKNRCTPKSSILIGFSMRNHPFWGTTIFGNTHIAFMAKKDVNRVFFNSIGFRFDQNGRPCFVVHVWSYTRIWTYMIYMSSVGWVVQQLLFRSLGTFCKMHNWKMPMVHMALPKAPLDSVIFFHFFLSPIQTSLLPSRKESRMMWLIS